MVNYPALLRPGVGSIKLRVTLKELLYELVSLTGLLEFLIESEGQELRRPLLHALGFLVLDHRNNVRLECREKTRSHLKLEVELLHCPGHEIVVALSV